MQDANNREMWCVWGRVEDIHEDFLCFLLNFFINLMQLEKKLFIKK